MAHFFLEMERAIVEKLQTLLEPIASSRGFELVHFELRGDRRQALLRVYLDKVGGITVDDCADFSGYLSTVLDVEDPIPFKYTLEVSSPGIEREFYRKSDYDRFRGESVKIQTHVPIEGRRTFHGRLIELKDEVVRVEERTLGREVLIPYPEIKRTQIEFDWRRR